MANSVRRCGSQESRLCTCRRSKRGTPQACRDASICAGPLPPEEIQTLSAENTGCVPSLLKPWPITFCEDPYIGEESIIRPPAAKNARMTSAQELRATLSLPTLKVIQLPSPTSGSASPLDGIGLVRTAACCAAAIGESMAAAPVAAKACNNPRRLRSGTVCIHPSVCPGQAPAL